MRLAIIGDTQHHRDADGRLCTLEPVAAQLDRWSELFDELVLCAPLDPAPPPPGFAPYRSRNLRLHPIRRGGGNNIRAKLGLIPLAFHWWRHTRSVAREVDAVHIRCPCNVGLIAVLATRGVVARRYAHYAGIWRGYGGEPRSYRWQRRLLTSSSFGGPVSVYSATPGPPHLVPFFSPSFDQERWDAASPAVEARLARLETGPSGPVRLVTVGRLSDNKNQQTVVRAVAELAHLGVDATLDVVGDGVCRPSLEALAEELAVDKRVRFLGAVSHPEVMVALERADLNVLATRQEGFGKVILEGMAAGAVPLMSESPVADEITASGRRGEVFSADDPRALADSVAALVADRERWAAMVRAAREYARSMTLEAFQARVAKMLDEHWGLDLSRRSDRSPLGAAGGDQGGGWGRQT